MFSNDRDAGSAYLFNRETKTLKFLYQPRPDLKQSDLVAMNPVRYKSLDGMEIPAYLSLPNVPNPKDLPSVLLVHGGPWARDYWGYNGFAQFLANRGYAVLQINFRGSTGYGKSFLNAAINQWGEKMQDDLTAGAQFLIDHEYANPSKIAIMGGSYGGYATLAGLTFTPVVYAAGVSIVGPSNLFTLLETIPPYWESARVMFHKRMGNPNTEEGRDQLKRQSPFFHAKNIKSPLMVAQGANDPRVKKSESDQIVLAMRDLNLDVAYLNFPDEGHGFANPKNNMAFIAAMEKFLADQIGGRYQQSVPDHLQKILDNVTVDISKLKMPTIVTDELKSRPKPEKQRTILEGTQVYEAHLSFQDQELSFELQRSIKKDGNNFQLTDASQSPMGRMSDTMKLDSSHLTVLEREVDQMPLYIRVEGDDQKIIGEMTMEEKTTSIDVQSDYLFIHDGPAQDVYVSALDLKNGGENSI